MAKKTTRAVFEATKNLAGQAWGAALRYKSLGPRNCREVVSTVTGLCNCASYSCKTFAARRPQLLKVCNGGHCSDNEMQDAAMSGFKKYMKEGGSANEWASNLPSSAALDLPIAFSRIQMDSLMMFYSCIPVV